MADGLGSVEIMRMAKVSKLADEAAERINALPPTSI
jgi:hypothetical protein